MSYCVWEARHNFFNINLKKFVMEKMKDLKDLLIHEIQDLYSAEEQIIEALPLLIEKAKDAKLIKSLKDHLKVTEQQKARLDDVKSLLMGEVDSEGADEDKKKKLFWKLFWKP